MSGQPVINRCIAHVDMDAFYASVEQRDRPELQGVPVLVGGSGARGVVAAASYEARRFGIRSAMPSTEARRRCPDAVFLSPRMARYKDISKQIFVVFREFTPEVEGLSLDEAYLDLTATLGMFRSVAALAGRIKDRIREETGLTASVGVGPNKLVAKIASDLDKPDGLCVLFGDCITRTLDPLPVRSIGGIGPRTAERLARHGIRSVRELRLAGDGVLAAVFGRYATRMRDKARGEDSRPVCSDLADHSISAEETFDEDVADRSSLRRRLGQLAERVAERVRGRQLQGAVVSIKIRKSDFETCTRQRRISPPTADAATLARVACELLDHWMDRNEGARLRLLGVGLSGLSAATQLALFGADDNGLDRALDAIRERFGPAAVSRGRALDRD
jgi:DNA polymerase-4